MKKILSFPATLDSQLRFAIANKRLLRFTYDGAARVAEPHDYGIQKGTLRLFAYQTRSIDEPSKKPGWRWFDISKIAELVVLDQTFKGSRSEPNQHHHEWDIVYVRVR